MSVPEVLLAGQANRGAGIRRLLRLALVAFFVAVLLTEPPASHLLLCWLLVLGYLAWALAIHGLATRVRTFHVPWLALFVDLAVLAALTLITDTAAAVSWTPYLIINGFFLIPLMAATQIRTGVCVTVVVPTVGAYLLSGLITQGAGQEPISYVLLRTLVLAAVGLGAILLTRLQHSRVSTIATLLDDRATLLTELVAIEQREQRDLAETLHDGALQYVLGARQELDDLVVGDPEALRRLDEALTESARLLRGTMSQLHPAVLEASGLLPALRDLVDATTARSGLAIRLTTEGWTELDRTNADGLVLSAGRELLTNVVKHAHATTITVQLTRRDGLAELRVSDDGIGMEGVDLDKRLAQGHLGLASRRIRLRAAGGDLRHYPARPHGTVVEVSLPVAPAD